MNLERAAWRAYAKRLKADRDRAEANEKRVLEELQRRDVREYDIAQMAELGLETRGVIYTQSLINELKDTRYDLERVMRGGKPLLTEFGKKLSAELEGSVDG